MPPERLDHLPGQGARGGGLKEPWPFAREILQKLGDLPELRLAHCRRWNDGLKSRFWNCRDVLPIGLTSELQKPGGPALLPRASDVFAWTGGVRRGYRAGKTP